MTHRKFAVTELLLLSLRAGDIWERAQRLPEHERQPIIDDTLARDRATFRQKKIEKRLGIKVRQRGKNYGKP